MALFRPTNIYPNLMSGALDGTVDATDDLTITWQINGPSAMNMFRIIIYDDGTAVYSNTVTLSSGVYGRDNLGSVVPYSYTIDPDDITDYANGNEYTFVIRVYWDSGSSYIDSPTIAFQTVAAPTFTTGSYSSTITARNWTFDFLTFSATPQWFEWILYTNEGTTAAPITGDTVYDTGKVWGSGDLTMDYDGFQSGTNYCLQCIVCDSYGRETTSDLYGFEVSYDEIEMDFDISVSALGTGSAIYVEWGGANYITGEATGNYTVADNILTLPTSGDYVTWDNANGSTLDLETPWTVVYSGTLLAADAILWELQMTNSMSLTLEYTHDSRTITLSLDGTALYTKTLVWWKSTVSTVLTMPESGDPVFYLRLDYMEGGTYPDSTLYPDTTLYPNADDTAAVYTESTTLTGASFTDIKAIVLYGAQECYYIQEVTTVSDIVSGLITQVYANGSYSPSVLSGTHFYATFENELQAGSLYYFDSEIAGWEIYRTEEGETIAKMLAKLPLNATSFTDYSARTDCTQYLYEIAPIFVSEEDDEEVYTNGASIKAGSYFGIISPYYTIIQCEYTDELECYVVTNEFNFGLNIKTGDVSNNNSPSISNNFTPYPTVQIAPQNYQTGTLTSLMGAVQYDSSGEPGYSDSRELRDLIFALSNTTDTLFLKTRKGDIFEIRISGAITISTMDGTKEQALQVTIPWVQVSEAH